MKILNDKNSNQDIPILQEKYVVSIDSILNLDIMEARHHLDCLVHYSGLKDMTYYDL